jgi:hypothetical protein
MSTSNDYFIGPEGIVNRNNLKGSPAGKVTAYFLSDEERLQLIEKYGPILRKRISRTTIIQKFDGRKGRTGY